MKVIKMEQIEGKINPRGVLARELLNNEHVKVMNLILQPGDSIPPHEVPVHVFFYVVSGKGTIQIGDKEAVVEEKDIVSCPPNTKMSLRADQDETLKVLNVKSPGM